MRPRFLTLLGVLLVSMSILTLEIILTRIFSVMMWYHFAFMVISLAMLGSGAAGVWIYLAPGRFPPEKVHQRLILLACLFSVATALALILYLRIPFDLDRAIREEGLTTANLGWLSLIYLNFTVPFLLGGATIALAMSHFRQAVSRVYFFDLAGASLGCLASILVLTRIGAAGAVLVVGVVGALAGLAFAFGGHPGRHLGWHWLAPPILLVLVTGGLVADNERNHRFQIRTRSGYDANNVLVYEKWNALARVTVYEDPYWLQPFGWGLSPTYQGPDPGHLLILIDAKAGTPIQKWDGRMESIDFLRYDLTSLAYYVLPKANSFIIGPGGGRDILTGLLFDASQITGVELNPAVVDAARTHFADYSGYVYDVPNVRTEIEDARTFLARSDQQFDLIQASLIDTWAASAAGAFALSENGLYTREAFQTYFERLSDRGMVSYSRWYYPPDPSETLRMVVLGIDAWQSMGIDNPAEHMVVIANLAQNRSATEGLATMLLKKTPFTADEISTLSDVSQQMAFTVLYAPGLAGDSPVAQLIDTPDLDAYVAGYSMDISAPTDNRPFFFNFVRPSGLLSRDLQASPVLKASVEANRVLLAVLVISLALSVLFVLLPLLFRGDAPAIKSRLFSGYLAYFGLLGLGFMLIEIPLIQRLNLYLGSPTYALAVVLLTILLGSSIGSLATSRISQNEAAGHLPRRLVALVLVGLALLLLLPLILRVTQAWTFGLRVVVTIATLGPAGFFMGQPFPLGVKWATQRAPGVVPWLWAINGTMSVVGSSLAIILALAASFHAVMLAGILCYTAAAGLILLSQQATASGPEPGIEPLSPVST
jgi:hypothetical protein